MRVLLEYQDAASSEDLDDLHDANERYEERTGYRPL